MDRSNILQAVERVAAMEHCFDRLQEAAAADPTMIYSNSALSACLQQLVRYYENGQWLQDYMLDEQGLLPNSLKRGVLSQDAVYLFLERLDGKSETAMGEGTMEQFDVKALRWTREPASSSITQECIEIVTKPHTDLWQRTYYHFRNDNAPVLQMSTEERYFSFTVKTEFDSRHRFDQCGIVLYLDSENWLKASVEYENETFQHLGSVVTNHGYSDWATTDIPVVVRHMWYRLSRRKSDYCIECSADGVNFRQMRICHLFEGAWKIRFGIYACSPEDSSFEAVFSGMELGECRWLPHDGQQPDEE